MWSRTTESRSGLSVTAPTGVQSPVPRAEAAGLFQKGRNRNFLAREMGRIADSWGDAQKKAGLRCPRKRCDVGLIEPNSVAAIFPRQVITDSLGLFEVRLWWFYELRCIPFVFHPHP